MIRKLTLLTLAFSLVASSALAAGTATLNVSASITGSCVFNAGGTLAFGALDVTAPVDVTANSSGVAFTCTNLTNYTITDSVAGAGSLSNGTSTIPYTLAYAATGVATGASQALAITGNILAANYATASAGAYTQAVTLTINP